MHIGLNVGMSADTAKLKVEHKSQLIAEHSPHAALTAYDVLPLSVSHTWMTTVSDANAN